ncbi:MAG TPA: HepT-like ribonuclease domain-containing protein [Bryobacteraceae bacterium]|nr:HepT-like ribonuclease domain-containing protein [Bryobacteraceae bacterium]
MPFEDPFEPLNDILEHIGHIEKFLEGMRPADLANDQRTVFACQYALLVISEAARRLGTKAEELCPGFPWRDIRGIGNRLRHAYDTLDSALIWKVYQDDLPPLKISVAAALNRLRSNTPGLPEAE